MVTVVIVLPMQEERLAIFPIEFLIAHGTCAPLLPQQRKLHSTVGDAIDDIGGVGRFRYCSLDHEVRKTDTIVFQLITGIAGSSEIVRSTPSTSRHWKDMISLEKALLPIFTIIVAL